MLDVQTACDVSASADERFVRSIERALAEDLAREERHAPAVLARAARHLCLAPGGKRARPRLVRLFGEAVGASPISLIDIGVAVELVHSASLLHDDVVDEGTTRRGLPTANVSFGNAAAVLAGDLALTVAFARLAPHRRTITFQAVAVVQEMTRAAMREIEARGRQDLGSETWREIAEGKTGALFGFCGHAAALLASDTERAKRFDIAARHLGVAFQLADDLGDLLEHGSDRFGDLVEKNPSYPVLRACERDAALSEALGRVWKAERVDFEAVAPIGERVLASPAVEDTKQAIRAEVAAARRALEPDLGKVPIARVMEWGERLANAM